MLKVVDRIFLEHPREQNVSYFQHLCISLSLSASFLCASGQACIHAFVPCCFETSSNDWIIVLNRFLRESYSKN